MDTIDMSSDTVTLPTPEMLEAIGQAKLGDDTSESDPTVNRLQRMAAELTGQEAALLVLSGTMGNVVSLMTHARTGEEVIVDADSHVVLYEVGALASVAGLMPKPVRNHRGLLDPDDVRAAIRERNVHFPIPRVLCLENTHNIGGGRVVPMELHVELCGVAREHGLAVHLDGARIFNAAVAAGDLAAEYTRHVDSVMFCLSKGLSCPLGSLVCGSAEFIDRARHNRKRIGGGMRQAGIIAAPGIVALETMIDRLADDHANARLLAEGINDVPGLDVDLDLVESNIFFVRHASSGLSTKDVVERFARAGVLASNPPGIDWIRFVTHRHLDRATVEEALRRIRRAICGENPKLE